VLSAEQLKSYITAGLACDFIDVKGDDGTHFDAVIVSPAFEGKRMLQQHQLVYAALGDRMKAEIHALGMKTYTPSDWAKLHGLG
jgi:acid stress-induced BolA-like protein IbaG/YrbA